jgi:hypothetical protein
MSNPRNTWVGYINRSYEQIKASVLARLGINNPEITDHSESNPLIILISIFAGIAEMLNYYIDNMAREAFLEVARRYSSVVLHSKGIDYRIRAINPASVDVLVSMYASNLPINLGGPVTFPSGTIVSTGNGTEFITLADLIIPAGQHQGYVGARQVTKEVGVDLGLTTGLAKEQFSLGTNYVHNSIILNIGGDAWTEVDSLGNSTPTNKHYIVDIHQDGIAYIVLGDGTFGALAGPGLAVTASLETSTGADANTIQPNTLTTIVTTVVIPGVDQILVTNPLSPTAGRNYENIEEIRFRAPLSLRTLERGVSYQDFIDLALLANGVGKAKLAYCCGACGTLYILPSSGGIAQLGLLTSTEAYICFRKMFTICMKVRPAGITPIALEILVVGKFRYTSAQLLDDASNALADYFALENQDINKAVRLSDMYARLDAEESIDYTTIQKISTIPYAHPQGNNLNPLYWVRITKPTCTTKTQYLLTYTGSDNFAVVKDNLYIQNLPIGTEFEDNDTKFTITPGIYALGGEWKFTVYPYGQDIVLDDFTIPSYDPDYITLNIQTTTSTLACKPNCNQ